MTDSNSLRIDSVNEEIRVSDHPFQQLNVDELNNVNSHNSNNKANPNSKAVAVNGQPVNERTIEVSWHNLVYTVSRTAIVDRVIDKVRGNDSKSRTILKGLTGYFRSGNLTAIMGPSGAGKSTLLECVSGFRKKGLSGDVRITGSSSIKIGLIAQNDQLLNQLTVKEALIFASKLKNYKQAETKELEEVIVDDSYAESQTKNSSTYHDMLARHVMKQLGLEVCADTRSGNCSGGQRKRLSIALELISK